MGCSPMPKEVGWFSLLLLVVGGVALIGALVSLAMVLHGQ